MGRYLSTIFVVTEFLYIFQDIYSKFCDSKSRYRYVQYYLSPIDDKCKYLTSTTIFDGSSRSKSSTAINLKADSNAGNEGRKFKIITPNDIGKIFESSPSSETDEEDDDEDEDDFDFNDSDDSYDIINIESTVEEESEYSVINIPKNRPPQKPSLVDFKDEVAELVVPTMASDVDVVPSNSKDSQIINELQALYSMSGMTTISEVPVKLIPQEETPDEFGYARLGQTLDKSTFRSVKDSITVKPLSSSSSSSNPSDSALRTFRYDPTLLKRGDPMLYGAYRRWKEVEINGASTGTDTKKKNGLGGKGKKNSKNAADKFYDALKKLGSGPAEKGSSSQTGIAEPPPNSKPIQPKKAPAKKNKKKIITPDDIDSLFKKPPLPSSADPDEASEKGRGRNRDEEDDTDDDDDDDDDEEEEEDDSETEQAEKKSDALLTISGSGNVNTLDNKKTGTLSAFNSYIGTDDGVPQWLQEAESEAKKKKAAKRNAKKIKKLTDDWRFWVAIIATVGFASAFYNVYQQTGGFGGAQSAFPFGSSGSGESVGEIVI